MRQLKSAEALHEPGLRAQCTYVILRISGPPARLRYSENALQLAHLTWSQYPTITTSCMAATHASFCHGHSIHLPTRAAMPVFIDLRQRNNLTARLRLGMRRRKLAVDSHRRRWVIHDRKCVLNVEVARNSVTVSFVLAGLRHQCSSQWMQQPYLGVVSTYLVARSR